MADYPRFVPTPQGVSVKIWKGGKRMQPRRYTLITYHRVDAGMQLVDDYLYLWIPDSEYMFNGGRFMSLDDLLARTGRDAKTAGEAREQMKGIEAIYKRELKTWTKDGEEDTLQYDDLPHPISWRGGEGDRWFLLAYHISKAFKKQFDAKMRYWNPATTADEPFELFLYAPPGVPRGYEMLEEAKRKVLQDIEANQKSLYYRIHVVQAVDPTAQLVKIGHNYFNLFDTYASRATCMAMLHAAYGNIPNRPSTIGTPENPWPIRPWPNMLEAGIADSKLLAISRGDLVERSPPRPQVTRKAISPQVILDRRQEERDRSQADVMGTVSASEFEGQFWPQLLKKQRKIPPPWNNEWLHRVAWSMGGAQRIENLCFGTSECNSDMMRAEAAIKRFVSSTNRAGELRTIVDDGAHAHDNPSQQAPPFVGPPERDQAPYSWAVAFLQYEFRVLLDAWVPPVIYSVEFDTFNRYVPLLIDTMLDDAIIDLWIEELGLKFGALTTDAVPDNVDCLMTAMTVASSGKGTLSLQVLADDLGTRADQTYTNASQAAKPFSPSTMKLKESVDLFGIAELHVDVYEYIGELPSGVQSPRDGSSPAYFAATLKSLSISTLFRELIGSPFDFVSLTDILVVYQNCLIDDKRGVGWSLECHAAICPNIGELNELARTLLGVDHLGLRLYANFGPKAASSWCSPLMAPCFTLQGILDMNPIELGSNVKLVNIGMKLHAIRAHHNVTKPASLKYGWELFGELSLLLPRATMPCIFDFSLTKVSNFVYIHGTLQGEIWENALGIQGLNLRRVYIDIDFELAKRPKMFDFLVGAELHFGSSVLDISGGYSEASGAKLTASWSNFGVKDIADLYKSITGNSLSTPNMDVFVDNATLMLSTKSGISLALYNVVIEDTITIEHAELEIHRDSVMLSAKLEMDQPLSEDLVVSGAEISFFIARAGSGQSSHLLLSGKTVCTWFAGSPTFDVSVYLYRPPNGSKLEYTVYGSVTTDDSWTIDKATGGKCPDFLKNIALHKLSILVASMENPEVGSLIIPDFELRKGVQICAQVDEIQPVNGIMRGSCPLLYLYASWPDLIFTIALPKANFIDFGHGFKTDAVAFTIDAKNIRLLLTTGIVYTPQSKGDPLKLSLILALDALGADATLDAIMTWNNPLGISEKVTIKELGLKIGLKYAQFLSTGTPSTLGVLGKFEVGPEMNEIVLLFGVNPTDELLKIDVSKIDVNELIGLASNLTKFSLPRLPDGAVVFDRFGLYACPNGATFGNHRYTAGFSADLIMNIFSRSLDAHLSLNASKFTCRATFNGTLEIGPLSVTGYFEPFPKVDLELSASTQRVLVDGRIQIGDLYCALYAQIKPQPSPAFFFTLTTNLFGSHELNLLAKLDSPPANWQDAHKSSSGFFFEGEFGDKARSALAVSIKEQFRYLSPKATVDSADSARIAEVLQSCRIRVAAAASSLQARLEQLAEVHTTHKEALRRLATECKSASDIYTQEVQQARAHLSTIQRKYEAELEDRMFSLRQAEAKAMSTSQKLNWAKEAEKACHLVPRDMSTTDLMRMVATSDMFDVSRIPLPTVSLAGDTGRSVEYPWSRTASMYAASQQKALARKLAFVEESWASLQADLRARSPTSDIHADAISQLSQTQEVENEEVRVCQSALQTVQEQMEAEVSSATSAVQAAENGNLYQQWQHNQAALAAETAREVPHVDEDGCFYQLKSLPESQHLLQEHQALASAVHASNLAHIVGMTMTSMAEFWKKTSHGAWSTIMNMLAAVNVLEIERVYVSGRFSSDTQNSDRGNVFSLKAALEIKVLGKSQKYQFDFDLAIPEGLILQCLKSIVELFKPLGGWLRRLAERFIRLNPFYDLAVVRKYDVPGAWNVNDAFVEALGKTVDGVDEATDDATDTTAELVLDDIAIILGDLVDRVVNAAADSIVPESVAGGYENSEEAAGPCHS